MQRNTDSYHLLDKKHSHKQQTEVFGGVLTFIIVRRCRIF